MKLPLAILCAVSCNASSASVAAPCLHYMGSPVTLSGTVALQTFYGPPNYGENPKTDSRETQAILQLAKPICIVANPGDEDAAEANQLKVTLVPNNAVNLKQYEGKQVTVRGTLFHANTGHHHTPVLMQLNGIEKNP